MAPRPACDLCLLASSQQAGRLAMHYFGSNNALPCLSGYRLDRAFHVSLKTKATVQEVPQLESGFSEWQRWAITTTFALLHTALCKAMKAFNLMALLNIIAMLCCIRFSAGLKHRLGRLPPYQEAKFSTVSVSVASAELQDQLIDQCSEHYRTVDLDHFSWVWLRLQGDR